MSLTRLTSVLAGLALVAVVALGSGAAYAGDVLWIGSFKGTTGHKSSGQVRIVKDGGTTKVVFGKNFKLDGAPDPKVAFGKNGYIRGTIFTKLNKLKGAQEYNIPAATDLSKFNQVWIWCEKFDVPLAFAKLKQPGA